MSSAEGPPMKRKRTAGKRGGFGGRNKGTFGRNRFEKPNHILVMRVVNPMYPITTEVIHTICSASGKVLRIEILKRNGIQALVEFDSIESAARTKEVLNGCDIYSGCCTLRIQFAKANKVTVPRNDNDTWDYTKSNSGNICFDQDFPFMHESGRGYGSSGYNSFSNENIYSDSFGYTQTGMNYERGYNASYSGACDLYGSFSGRDQYMPDWFRNQNIYPPQKSNQFGFSSNREYEYEMYRRDILDPSLQGNVGGYAFHDDHLSGSLMTESTGVVMMIYGINDEKMNPDMIFNLLCLYGNVVKINFLKSKKGSAMIEMASAEAVHQAIKNLNNVDLFGSRLRLAHSKQPHVNDVSQPFQLPDNSPSFKNYSTSKNQRFSTTSNDLGKNRVLPPSKVLHFFNAPHGITEPELIKIFEDAGTSSPVSVRIFPPKNESNFISTGLLEFSNLSSALEALVLCNHVKIPNPKGRFPFVFKLCFSYISFSGFNKTVQLPPSEIGAF